MRNKLFCFQGAQTKLRPHRSGHYSGIPSAALCESALVTAAFCFGTVLPPSEEVLRAQDTNKPAIPPQPRTINLTQEQRFVIKENVKDLKLSKARKDAPETIGDPRAAGH